ncbi:hypothetical protein JNJ66_01235 [Candidatus Saccharibacteria bacterium]|nr:hypothetical protein [Candidatus Saccharibacteria bacterium]
MLARLLPGLALVLALALAACGGGSEASGTASATPGPPAVTATMVDASKELTVVAKAVVDTRGTSGCDEQARPGDCYLPAYPRPAFTGTPLNLSNSPGSTCAKPSHAGAGDASQQGCWPQPDEVVELVCSTTTITTEGTDTWHGFVVPDQPDKLLSPQATPSYSVAGQPGAQVGFNKSLFLRVIEGNANALPECPAAA